jgi:hypothetical protein
VRRARRDMAASRPTTNPGGTMHRLLVALACVAPVPLSHAFAQTTPDSLPRGREAATAYDELADSTTRRVSVYAIVDTSRTPPDTFAVELSQRWRGRGTTAPVESVELGLGHTRVEGLRAGQSLLWSTPRRPAVVFLLDGARRIRLEQTEYASDGGRVMTFETARYRISPADLRRIAEARELRVRVGDRELWIDPAWRTVAAEMVAGQAPAGEPVRKQP